jgi:predicted nucleic acid-binding protein
VRRVCADTGFLIALYGEQGDQHDRASAWFEQLFARPGHQLLLPWPALYEAINTRLVRDPRQLEVMERDWTLLHRNGRLDYLSDEPYREDALAEIFAETRRPRQSYRRLSLADRVIRALLADMALRVDVLLTNDESAFHDICRIRGLEMISILPGM